MGKNKGKPLHECNQPVLRMLQNIMVGDSLGEVEKLLLKYEGVVHVLRGSGVWVTAPLGGLLVTSVAWSLRRRMPVSGIGAAVTVGARAFTDPSSYSTAVDGVGWGAAEGSKVQTTK